MLLRYIINPEVSGEKMELVSIETRNLIFKGLEPVEGLEVKSITIDLPVMAEVGCDNFSFFVRFETVVNDRSDREENFLGVLEVQHTRKVRIRLRMREDELSAVIAALGKISQEAEAEYAAFVARQKNMKK